MTLQTAYNLLILACVPILLTGCSANTVNTKTTNPPTLPITYTLTGPALANSTANACAQLAYNFFNLSLTNSLELISPFNGISAVKSGDTYCWTNSGATRNITATIRPDGRYDWSLKDQGATTNIMTAILDTDINAYGSITRNFSNTNTAWIQHIWSTVASNITASAADIGVYSRYRSPKRAAPCS